MYMVRHYNVFYNICKLINLTYFPYIIIYYFSDIR